MEARGKVLKGVSTLRLQWKHVNVEKLVPTQSSVVHGPAIGDC